MAEEAKNKASASKFRTSIGGQALIEGVLMRGPGKQAIVVRSPDGLVEKVEKLTLVRDKYPVLGLPIIRGAVTFVDSMVKGVKALMFSADYFPDEDVAEPSKFDQWLEKKLGNEKMQKFITALAVFLSLGLTILLFFLLPLSYYILEYTLTVYTDLLYTGGPVIIDFMDSFLVLFFFILAMVSLDFSNKKSTAERENLLLTTAAAQA